MRTPILSVNKTVTIFVYLVFLFVGVSNVLFASPEDKKELPELAEREIKGSGKIQFENRSNRVASKEFHMQQIEYGKSIARRILKTGFVQEKDIDVRRINSDLSNSFGADIFILGENFKIGHINGLVRILTGYLMEAFEYDYEHARMLSNIIIFYNATIRKDIDQVKKRYNQLVVQNLTPEHIGIDQKFFNWAGETEILIPLRNSLVRPGGKDMNTGELQEQTIQNLDDETIKQLDEAQVERRQEDKDRLTIKSEETKKRLREEKKKRDEAEKQLREERAKAEQDLEKIKRLEAEKKAKEQKILEEKKRQAALRKQLEESIPKVIPKIVLLTVPEVLRENVTEEAFENFYKNALSITASSGFYQRGKNIYINSDTKFSLKASDDISKIGYTEYRIDDAPFKHYKAPFSLADEKVETEGKHSIVYHSVDNAGNIEEEKSYFVVIDDTAPQVFMENKNKKNIYTKGQKIFVQKFDELILSAKDNSSGIKKIFYKINGSDLKTYVTPIKVDQNEEINIEYGSEDQVGNKSIAVSRVEADDTPPDIDIIHNREKQLAQNLFYTKDAFMFQVSVSDSQSGVKEILVRVDKQGDFNSFKELVFEPNSEHVIEIKATDNIGNTRLHQFVIKADIPNLDELVVK